ncbi:hypothetical protein NC651_011296 [Populus alba x Populus x berolinensis]|nr:hypothetical protein NC651_011296 [Populus alba x Populus x berolinensis]
MNMHVNSGFLHFLSFQFITICVEGILFHIFQGSRCLPGFPVQDEYQRLGYTSLSPSKEIQKSGPIDNGYKRFIPAAYSFYGAAFSMALLLSKPLFTVFIS